MKRRHFLLQAASCLPCCLLPEDLMRRALAAIEAGDTAAAIAAPTHAATTLYAVQDDYRLLFSLGSTETEPEDLTWRNWADIHGGDVDDPAGFRDLAIGRGLLGEDEPVDRLFKNPDEEVSSKFWWEYFDQAWAHTDSPQAQAYHYLAGLDLGNSGSAEGTPLGELKFFEGPVPGSNWTWVESDSELVLPALQNRLLELGEDVSIIA